MVDVKKSSGRQEPFNRQKLCISLENAGAPHDIAQSICRNIEQKITPNISTHRIFRSALRELIKTNRDVAARYSIHRGIAALGPAGFFFEQYVEAILQAYGYKTKRDTIMKGACISHEIDLTATRDNVHYLFELKYHNEQGIKTHVPVVMYADARLQDISKIENKKEKNRYEHRMWLVTNTKFTDTAITYAKCKHIKLTGWNYPKNESLEDLIANKKLYPVTILPSISSDILTILAEKKIILAQDLATYDINDLISLGMNETTAHKIQEEVRGLFV